jgi:nitrogen-specific signal transduction histidine kinase
MWPFDRAWFLASEIDVPWTGVAGSAGLLEELMADNVLDTELVDLTSKVPY